MTSTAFHSLHNEEVTLDITSEHQSHKETVLCRGSVTCTVRAHTVREGQTLHVSLLAVWWPQDQIKVIVDWNTALPHSQVHIHCVALIGNEATVHIEWWITIPEWVNGVNWTLMEENIILWKRCTLYTLPMLDVQSNDVQASHWATVHSLDPYKMFYLQSRGIDAWTSQSILIWGHITTILGEGDGHEHYRALAYEYALKSL